MAYIGHSDLIVTNKTQSFLGNWFNGLIHYSAFSAAKAM